MSERAEVVVLGAGFGGLAVAHRLACDGIDDVLILERDDGVGGTWRANRYPGAACDVPSHLYSLSFAPNPDWSSAYASQAEILDYIEACYERFDLRRRVRTGTAVTSAEWDEGTGWWTVRDAGGGEYVARVVVSAVGMFNTPKYPDIGGLDRFDGPVVHSARWDDDVELAGRRVAVVGTGASAIQLIPPVAERADHVDVYQRSAPWVLPRRNRPYSAEERERFGTDPVEMGDHRRQLYEMLESTTLFIRDDPLAATLASVSRQYLEDEVPDVGLREQLVPTHPFGCTRVLISDDYYPALGRDDVEVVTTGIDRITPGGIRTTDGTERPADVIVLCTGFTAADYLPGIDVRGRDGEELHDRWGGVPCAYHGLAVPGFPNFFMLYGPNTNQGGNSILLMLEAQSQFVAAAIEATREANATWMDVTPEAMADYERQLRDDLSATIWAGGCTTYFHTPAGDIVTQLPHKSGWYVKATDAIDLAHVTFGGGPCTTS